MRRRSRAFSACLVVLSLAVFAGLPPAEARASGDAVDAASYLSSVEKDVIREINLARTSPQQYAAYLEQIRKYYRGKHLGLPGREILLTEEGVPALDEAIRFLREAKPLPALQASKGMFMAAKDHAKDIGPTGQTGHKGSDGSMVENRVNRYGSWALSIGENIAYDKGRPREVVIGWIIDDGVPNRGHRKYLFDPSFQFTGVATGAHATFGTLYVITFAGRYAEKGTTATTTAGADEKKQQPAARKF